MGSYRTQSSTRNRVPMMEMLECRQFMSTSTATPTPQPAPKAPPKPPITTGIPGEQTDDQHAG